MRSNTLIRYVNNIRFRRIEKKIDQYIVSEKFLEHSESILKSFFLMSNEYLRRFGQFYSTANQNIDNPFYTSLALSKALSFVYRKGRNDKQRQFYVYKNINDFEYLISHIFLQIENPFNYNFNIIGYNLFEEYSKLYSRKHAEVIVKNNRIQFFLNDLCSFRLLVFHEIVSIPLKKYFYQKNKKESSNDWAHAARVLGRATKDYFGFSDDVQEKIILMTMDESCSQVERLAEIDDNWNFGSYSLKEYRKFWVYLRAKCLLCLPFDLFNFKNGQYPIYYIQKKTNWIDEISDGASLDKRVVESIIDDLTFFNKKDLGIQIQPFVGFDDFGLALPPSVVVANNIERNLMDLQCKINKKMYDSISTKKEAIMLSEINAAFEKHQGLLFKNRIKIKSTKTHTDIDSVVYEECSGYLYLIQFKWLLFPGSLLDYFSREGEIDKGMSQVKKSLDYVKSNFNKFLTAHFPMIPQSKIKGVRGFLVCRGSVGIKKKHINSFLIDYDVFKLFISSDKCTFDNIIEVIENQLWLPKVNEDFTIKEEEFKIGKYKMIFSGFEIIKRSDKEGISGLKKLNDYFSKISV